MFSTKNDGYNIAIVGATGNVGKEIISILGERNFPINNIYALASKQSVGKKISINLHKTVTVEALDSFDYINKDIDIAFFCAGNSISEQYAEKFAKTGCVVIDKSSYFRMHNNVPLIVPEINANKLKEKHSGIIATPNCTTIPLVLCLKPLDDKFKIKRVVVTTFQSVSGTGKKAMDELYNQTKGFFEASIQHLENDHFHGDVYPKQIAFNCIPQCDDFLEDGYTKEEYKMINETEKIIGKKIPISVTCVRVPVFRCHAESVNIEFKNDFDIDELIDHLSNMQGIIIENNNKNGKYAVQCDAVGTDCAFVSRIRKDTEVKNCVNFWIVCDNLRKGAALNGVQIAEKIIENI